MIVSKDKNINTSGLIIDARSITQLIYIYSVYGNYFSKKNSILIWKGNKDDMLLAFRILNLDINFFLLDIDISEQNLFFNLMKSKKIINVCNKIKKLMSPHSSSFSICTCFASGLYFDLIQRNLKVSNSNIIQFDDGNINLFIQERKYRLLRFFINLMHGFILFHPKYKLFSDKRFNRIYSSINLSDNNVKNINTKSIKIINNPLKNLFKTLSKNNIKISSSNSILFMTSPTIECKRMTKIEYGKLIKYVYNRLRGISDGRVYLSKHPSEKNYSDSLYKELGFDFKYQNYPSELFLSSKNIKIIVNALNTTLMMSDQLDLLKNITSVISYCPKHSPYVPERIEQISNILEKRNINHILIDKYE